MVTSTNLPGDGLGASCESCGMPIEHGQYCEHCTDAKGQLQPFAQRLESMVAWQQERNPGLSPQEARSQTLTYLAGMPAWRGHPELAAAISEGRPGEASAPGGTSGSW